MCIDENAEKSVRVHRLPSHVARQGIQRGPSSHILLNKTNISERKK